MYKHTATNTHKHAIAKACLCMREYMAHQKRRTLRKSWVRSLPMYTCVRACIHVHAYVCACIRLCKAPLCVLRHGYVSVSCVSSGITSHYAAGTRTHKHKYMPHATNRRQDHIHTYIHMHTSAQADGHACAHNPRTPYTKQLPCGCTRRPIHRCVRALTSMHAQKHIHNAHINHARSCTSLHAQSRNHAHTCAHKHAQMHKYMHKERECVCACPCVLWPHRPACSMGHSQPREPHRGKVTTLLSTQPKQSGKITKETNKN